jgi:hypothetical protein
MAKYLFSDIGDSGKKIIFLFSYVEKKGCFKLLLYALE